LRPKKIGEEKCSPRQSFGKLEYEIRDGEILYKDGGPTRVMVPECRPGATGAHAGRSARGADRRVRHRLQRPQSNMDLALHRHDSAGRELPRPARIAGR
jgi:hypothetical protein